MELDEALRTTFSCREWTNDPVTDEDIEAIVDLARFGAQMHSSPIGSEAAAA